MKVLLACEESQAVCKEFRKLGHEAYSCDILECGGGEPQWHIQQDVIPLLNGSCVFKTADGATHKIVGRWDMIIAFPPCTYLTVTGNRWFDVEKYGHNAIKRIKDREKAVEFFMLFVNADCERIAIENPVGIMSTKFRKPNQIINPWMFGDTDNKKTCLWLKGLPNLIPTNIIPKDQRTNNNWKAVFNGKQYAWNDPNTAKFRSKTYLGIAKAIADQWGKEIDNGNRNFCKN